MYKYIYNNGSPILLHIYWIYKQYTFKNMYLPIYNVFNNNSTEGGNEVILSMRVTGVNLFCRQFISFPIISFYFISIWGLLTTLLLI